MRSPGAAAVLLGLAACAMAQNNSTSALPTVDLGYTIQQATTFNSTGNFYDFSNIRFAEPPVGDLRFAAPVPAKTNRTVQTGEINRACYQANPAWEAITASFLPDFLLGNTAAFYNSSTSSSSNSTPSIPPVGPGETEDCLFLDVAVPQEIFDNRSNCSGGAPVLVWIYGGGYVEGSKNADGNPSGLLAQSQDGRGVIYVTINYRLGAFGWLGGPTLQSNGSANAGLLDQRLALEWVQQHIGAFGGDPTRVTIFGESAGGGSIMHQITAYGGNKGPVPFQQAIPQSPAFQPIPDNYIPEQTTQQFLQALNVSTIQQARGLPSMVLRNVNYLLVGMGSYGTFAFGPVVDGDFVPALPGKLLLQGSYDKDLTLMIGHNSDEGLIFTNPYITNDTALTAYLQQGFPLATPSVLSYITNVLYPPIVNGTSPLGYTNEVERAAFLISEALFTCNTNYLARAFNNQTYNYLFSIYPGLHGQDVDYTYYNSDAPPSTVPLPINATVAIALQKYITEFAESGAPNEPGVPHFNLYGNNSQVLNLGTNISEIMDPTANARCLWWQKALYF